MTPGRVTLLTDFGTADGYAAAMTGVIAARAPATLVDHASHSISPGDVLTAALTLARYAFLYPPATVHVVVVDPGVGTDRRAIAGRVGGRYFVAPDNGVLTRVLQHDPHPALVQIEEHRMGPDEGRSATFHGRDVFAPAAAILARGDPLEELGPALSDPTLLPLPEPEIAGVACRGEVIQVDRYGNLITNIPGPSIRPGGSAPLPGRGWTVWVGDRLVGSVRRTYGDVRPGALLAVVGSLGLIEVSVRDGSAADRLGAGRGTPVTLQGSRLQPVPLRASEAPLAAGREETHHHVPHQHDGRDREEEELDQANGEPEHRADHGEGQPHAHDREQADHEERQ